MDILRKTPSGFQLGAAPGRTDLPELKFVRVICEDLLQERWRLMTRRRLNRRAVVVDAEEAYLLEALARLLASSWKARRRVVRVMDLFRRTLEGRI